MAQHTRESRNTSALRLASIKREFDNGISLGGVRLPRKGLKRKSFFAVRSKRKKDCSGKPGPNHRVCGGWDAPIELTLNNKHKHKQP
jgi:hypothetical protein